MESSDTGKTDSEKGSRKKLVRILVVIFIGIPVLVELMTLFNLFNVQLFEEEKEQPIKQEQQLVSSGQLQEGDTLFAEYSSPLRADRMRVKVSAQAWRFELVLAHFDSSSKTLPSVRVDSLLLRSGQMLRPDTTDSWSGVEGNPLALRKEWELPTGDVPTKIFMRSRQAVEDDSTQWVEQEIALGNLPVRYERE